MMDEEQIREWIPKQNKLIEELGEGAADRIRLTPVTERDEETNEDIGMVLMLDVKSELIQAEEEDGWEFQAPTEIELESGEKIMAYNVSLGYCWEAPDE